MQIDNTSFVLAVDVDGVQANYERGFAKVVAEATGVDVEDIPPSTDWHFTNWDFGEGGSFMKHHTKLIQDHGFRDLEPIPGVAEAMQRFSDEGIYVRVVTHRLVVPHHHAVIIRDTVDWLDACKIPYRDICFAANKTTVGADLYVDDAPHNYEALVGAGIPCVLYDQVYNRHVDAPLRARGWKETEEIVLNYYNEWKKR